MNNTNLEASLPEPAFMLGLLVFSVLVWGAAWLGRNRSEECPVRGLTLVGASMLATWWLTALGYPLAIIVVRSVRTI